MNNFGIIVTNLNLIIKWNSGLKVITNNDHGCNKHIKADILVHSISFLHGDNNNGYITNKLC